MKIRCLLGLHAWFAFWLRMEDATARGLPKAAIRDGQGRVWVNCCSMCGKVQLAGNRRDKMYCKKCGRLMHLKRATKDMPERYACTGCGHAESVTAGELKQENSGATDKVTLLD